MSAAERIRDAKMSVNQCTPARSLPITVRAAIAVAMLVFIIAVGAYETRGFASGRPDESSTQAVQEQTSQDTEQPTETDTQTKAPGYTVPLE